MRAIKTIVFDAYGTLFDVHSVIAAAERLFPGQGRKISEIWRQKQLEYTWLRSLMGRYKDFWKVTDDSLLYTLETLNLPSDEQVRSLLLREYLVLNPFPDVPAAFNQLKDYKLAILSNGTPYMLHSVVSHTGLSPYLSGVISVDQLKIYKPFPGVYQLALTNLNVRKEEVLFVSANSFDAAGGKSFGFTVCWVNRLHTHFDELDVTPDLVVNNLEQLANLLAGSGGRY
ncbi:haloacid dehalogenase type II [Paenibacillus sp. N4]|uniref:haloacid dehalogenase type II n=1 Tax=Paenibacillus vietnamensis TaxID=2590547 RepID=UPI001CD127CA|nr:haloacid dehalogenase type II [Paenibacillus vietnamensis]MCA0758093.1 haloacid dehalogenase type II [Paenibacillus vietnamensis]